jgi:hypothetical protein
MQFTPKTFLDKLHVFEHPSYLVGVAVLLGLGFFMVQVPLRAAGRADEPAPPTAMM